MEEIVSLQGRVSAIERQIGEIAKQTPIAQLLMTIPGIGVLSATALVAMVGDAARFPSSRHFASFLGLTPKESSSGHRRYLGRISKRGDTYLRMLLVNGARSIVQAADRHKDPDDLRFWILQKKAEIGHNKTTIATANKMARFAWSAWTTGRPFEERRRQGK